MPERPRLHGRASARRARRRAVESVRRQECSRPSAATLPDSTDRYAAIPRTLSRSRSSGGIVAVCTARRCVDEDHAAWADDDMVQGWWPSGPARGAGRPGWSSPPPGSTARPSGGAVPRGPGRPRGRPGPRRPSSPRFRSRASRCPPPRPCRAAQAGRRAVTGLPWTTVDGTCRWAMEDSSRADGSLEMLSRDAGPGTRTRRADQTLTERPRRARRRPDRPTRPAPRDLRHS